MAVTLLILFLMLLLTGCGKSNEPQIIGTRQQESQIFESEDDGQGAETAGNNVGLDSGKDMADPDETYQAAFTTDQFSVTAQAPVTMPEKGIVKETYGVKENFSQDTFEQVSKVLSESFDIAWRDHSQEADEGGNRIFMTDQEEQYQIDYGTLTAPGNSLGRDSFIWCVNLGKGRNWGSTDWVQRYDITNGEVESKRHIAQELETKTKQMLKEMGLSKYQLQSCWWTYQTYSQKQNGAFFYQAVYTPSWSEIPFVSQSSYFGNVNASGPYLQVMYGEDGSLEQFKLIDTYEEEPSPEESQPFLLPFQSIVELFEQYIRDYGAEKVEELRGGEYVLLPQQKAGTIENDDKRRLQVTRVVMEYAWIGNITPMESSFDSSQPQEDREEKVQTRNKLVPVWSFYGRIDSGSETLLLSIRADDGQALAQ